MHPSIGMETQAPSTRWDDVRQGPSKAEVRAHVHKLANYPALMAQQQAIAAQPQPVAVTEELRLAAQGLASRLNVADRPGRKAGPPQHFILARASRALQRIRSARSPEGGRGDLHQGKALPNLSEMPPT